MVGLWGVSGVSLSRCLRRISTWSSASVGSSLAWLGVNAARYVASVSGLTGKSKRKSYWRSAETIGPFIQLKTHSNGLSVEPCAQGLDPRIDRFRAVFEAQKLSSLSTSGLEADIVFGVSPVQADKGGKCFVRSMLHVSPPRV